MPADWGKRHKLRAALAASSSRDGGVKSAAKTRLPSWTDLARLSSKTVVIKGADGDSPFPQAQEKRLISSDAVAHRQGQ